MNTSTARRQIRFLILAELGLGAMGIAIIFFFSGSGLERLALSPDIGSDLASGAGLAVMLAIIMLTISFLFPTLKRVMPEMLLRFIRRLTIWQSLAISLAAGIGEELLFRGAIQPATGVVIASFLFGLVHPVNKTYIALATVLGMILGYSYQHTGSLYTVMLAHAGYDFIIIELIRAGFLSAEPPERELRGLHYPEEYPGD